MRLEGELSNYRSRASNRRLSLPGTFAESAVPAEAIGGGLVDDRQLGVDLVGGEGVEVYYRIVK